VVADAATRLHCVKPHVVSDLMDYTIKTVNYWLTLAFLVPELSWVNSSCLVNKPRGLFDGMVTLRSSSASQAAELPEADTDTEVTG
jgi:hypothetical protein